MGAGFIDAKGLPQSPIDAAAHFHARIVPAVRESIASGNDAVLVFDPADHMHSAWRKAAIQELAREAAPCRINAVVGSDVHSDATLQVMQYLQKAPGVTGQVLHTDSNSAQAN